jgi:Rod binding domain-containing protein
MVEGISGSPAAVHAGQCRGRCEEDPVRLEEAAKQFEALLLAYMLKSMREAGSGGWLGAGEDQTAAPAMELAQEQFAQALAAQGGLGLAELIVTGFKIER